MMTSSEPESTADDHATSASPGDASQKPSALRMRRYRERKKAAAERQQAGTMRVFFDLSPAGLDLLADLGWLLATDRENVEEVEHAFGRFVNHAAQVGVTPPEPPPTAPAQPAQPEWLRILMAGVGRPSHA